jgi:hypothetical protein
MSQQASSEAPLAPKPPRAKPRMTWDDVKKEVDELNAIIERLEEKLPKFIDGFQEVYDSIPDLNLDKIPFERRVSHMHRYFYTDLEKRENLINNLKKC